jgi:hypothetical protein
MDMTSIGALYGIPVALQSVSIIIAAIAVMFGVHAWRREFLGKKRIELAEDVLALFYEARDAIRYIRNPLGYAGEGSTRTQSESEDADEKKVKDQAYVIMERYINRQELFNKIHSMRYRFMSHFGKEAGVPFEELRKIENNLMSSARFLAGYWLCRRRGYDTQDMAENIEKSISKYEAIFWEGAGQPDPIAPKVDKLVSDIEDRCNGIIGKGSQRRNLRRLIVFLAGKARSLYERIAQRLSH